MKKRFVKYTIFMILCFVWLSFGMTADAKDIVIVIDPGHGGENLGAEWQEYTEKDMTMVIATAMRDELEKYNGVQVYLTREKDEDLSLQERCDIAKELNADFLFCLHLNMHETHDVFGSEVWIPSKGKNYVKGYQFATIALEQFEDLGLYNRGIKTRLNDRGGEYYGILRHSEEYGYPCALVEHCHLDHKNDVDFYDSVEDLKRFGVLDAMAVAKYFGLTSDVLGVSYEGYELVEVEAPSVSLAQDLSPADFVELEVNGVNEDKAVISCTLKADDYDSYVLYYSISYNGGLTYSELYPFNRETSMKFDVEVPYGRNIDLVARVYNKYDQIAESNVVSIAPITDPNAVEEVSVSTFETQESLVTFETENEVDDTFAKKDIAESKDNGKNGKRSLKNKLLIAGGLFLISIFCVTISAIISIQVTKASHKKGSKKKTGVEEKED